MDTQNILIRLGIALGLGLLVGLQRERKGEELAGIRTFALLTVLGTLLAIVGKQSASAWIVPAGAVALGAILSTGYFVKWRAHHTSPHVRNEIGLTTEVAALVMYGLGAYLAEGEEVVALVLGGAVVLLLFWKNVLHGFVKTMGDRDISAIMQFVLIALVIWPVLPNERFGPYGFFNPFGTWLVVVLIVSMSLGGYVLYKFVPPTASALLGGAVGGLISSTAVTVSYSRRARGDAAMAPLAAQAIMMANTVSACRVIFLLALFAHNAFLPMLLPLAAMVLILALLTLASFWLGRHARAELPVHGNPTELPAALLFAFIYSAVKLGTAWGKDTFGTAALYVVAAISGLTDLDAITLSMSESAQNQSVTADLAGRVIIVAILANLVFKGGCVLALGSPRLKKWIAALYATALVAGITLILTWPQ